VRRKRPRRRGVGTEAAAAEIGHHFVPLVDEDAPRLPQGEPGTPPCSGRAPCWPGRAGASAWRDCQRRRPRPAASRVMPTLPWCYTHVRDRARRRRHCIGSLDK
jgi:hypothetical protein